MTDDDLCPEREYRDSLTDDEFFTYVAGRMQRLPWEGDPGFDPETEYLDGLGEDERLGIPDPCPTCGSASACAWDSEGRPMIHVLKEDEES
jgi:hypothetical protein